jgi:hypothetical protein
MAKSATALVRHAVWRAMAWQNVCAFREGLAASVTILIGWSEINFISIANGN